MINALSIFLAQVGQSKPKIPAHTKKKHKVFKKSPDPLPQPKIKRQMLPSHWLNPTILPRRNPALFNFNVCTFQRFGYIVRYLFNNYMRPS